jgi:hypothetical protein
LINQNFVISNNDNIYETFNSNRDVVNNNNNTFCSINTDKRRKLLKQSNRSKKVSFDADNKNNNTQRGKEKNSKHIRNDSYKNVKIFFLIFIFKKN